MDLEPSNYLPRPLQRLLMAIALVGCISFLTMLVSPDTLPEAGDMKQVDTFEYNKLREEEL